MARLWSSGFELNSLTSGVEFSLVNGTNEIDTTTIRSGTYSSKTASLVDLSREGLGHQFASTGTGPFYIRFYFRYVTLPTGDSGIFRFIAVRAHIELSSSGTLKLNDEDGEIGESSALDANTWYMVELLFDVSGSAGSHEVRARLNGVEFAGANNRDISSGVSTAQFGGNINNDAGTTGEWYFDDIAINDSSGSFQNSWPGEGEIIHLRPNANGDNEDWSHAGDNWEEVDEVTPDDATTRVSSSTDENIDDYNLTATPAALASDDTINCVQVGIRARMGIASGSIGIVTRIKAASAGTVEESGEITLTSTTWITNATAAPRNYPLTLYDLPGASTTAWTKADLDTAQIGMRVNTDSSAFSAEVSTIWLLVDHKPTAATTTSTSTTSSTSTSSTTTSSSTSSTTTSSSTSSTTTSSSTSTSSTTTSSSTSSTTTSSSTSSTTTSSSTSSTTTSSSTSSSTSTSSTTTSSSTSTSTSSTTTSSSTSTSSTTTSSSTSSTTTSSSTSSTTTSSSTSTSSTTTSSSTSTSSTTTSSSTSTSSTTTSSSTSSSTSTSSTTTSSSTSTTVTVSTTSTSTTTTSTSSSTSSSSSTSTTTTSTTTTLSTTTSTSTTTTSTSTTTTSTSTTSSTSSSTTTTPFILANSIKVDSEKLLIRRDFDTY